MKLNTALFPPLFGEVKKVQDTLVSYCIAGDTIPLPNDNLQYAIEQTYDVRISPCIAPLGSSLLRGLFEKYHHGSTIYIDGDLNSAWSRYVFAKEACHHLLSGDEFLTLDLTKVIKTIVLDDPEFNGSTTADSDVQSELLTKFSAIELLFPLQFRDQCKVEVDNGVKSSYEISVYFDIPEHLIQGALTDNYMSFSKHIWEKVAR
jgi:hypothetical protein